MLSTNDMPATKYILGDLAGVGGMGMVHRAMIEGQPGTVAIKQLRPELIAEPFMVDRFEAELRIGRLLEHPNITRVLDEGTTPEGAPFFVMAWVDGKPLGPRIADRGAVPVREAVAIVTRILDALAFAHEHGIVHGDVKADNVLVAGEGETVQVTLIDWGLARLLAEPAPVVTDFVSGTPGYMAPEVLRGEPPSIASDLYSAGVILYELLTGVSPFGIGTGTEIAERQLHGEIAPPSARACEPTLAARLDRAVLRALAKEPSGRPASARELAAAIAVPRIEKRRQTLAWRQHGEPRTQLAVGTRPPAAAEVQRALESSDDDAIATRYLTRAAELLSAHRLREAAQQLQLAVDTLTMSPDPSPALWPVLLSLAAVRVGLGDRAAARQLAHDARDHAVRSHAELGTVRAEALLRRLAR